MSSPTLIINDSLKKCSTYVPSNRTELISGWHYTNTYIGWEKWDNYCKSLGYNFVLEEKVSQMLPIFSIIHYGFWILFIGLIYLFYRIFIKKRKKYFIFLICIILSFIILLAISRLFGEIAEHGINYGIDFFLHPHQ